MHDDIPSDKVQTTDIRNLIETTLAGTPNHTELAARITDELLRAEFLRTGVERQHSGSVGQKAAMFIAEPHPDNTMHVHTISEKTSVTDLIYMFSVGISSILRECATMPDSAPEEALTAAFCMALVEAMGEPPIIT